LYHDLGHGPFSHIYEDVLRRWGIRDFESGELKCDPPSKFINGYVPVYSKSDSEDETIDRILHGDEENKEELLEMIKDGGIKSFHHISAMSLRRVEGTDKFEGLNRLGVLKADVDNLGTIFSHGIGKKDIVLVSTVSRQFNEFFSFYLPHFLHNSDEFRDKLFSLFVYLSYYHHNSSFC